MNQTWLRLLPPFLRAKLDGKYALQKILNNTVWLLADRVLRLSVGVVIEIAIARYLGPDQFGLISYAIALVALFSTLSTLGLDSIVIRDIVRQPEAKNALLGTAFTLKWIASGFTWLLVVGVVFLLRPGDSLTHWLVGITAAGILFQAFDTIDLWFQSQVQTKYTVFAKTTAFITLSLVKVGLIHVHAPVIAFAWTSFLEAVLGALGLIVTYGLSGAFITTWRSHGALAKRLLQDSYPMILSGLVIMVYMRIDQLMLAEKVGNQAVGIYSAAVKLAEAWYFIPTVIVSSTFPSIVQAKQLSEAMFEQRLQRLYQLMALLAYLVAIPTSIFSNWIVQILFGSAYAESGPILAVLIWAGIFVNLGVARSSFLTTMNWTKVHLLTVSIGCLINVLLNLILIPPYAGMGAAIATCIAYFFATYGACFLYKPLWKTGWMLTKAMVLIGK
jgi:O-antigen/teichoic acid export membrane protein